MEPVPAPEPILAFSESDRLLLVANSPLSRAAIDVIVDQPGNTECKRLIAGLLGALINCMGGKPRRPLKPTDVSAERAARE